MANETNTITVGSIFAASWGYDQTNVDFFEVCRMSKSGKTVWVRAISGERVTDSSVRACAGSFSGPEMKKALRFSDFWRGRDEKVTRGMFKVSSYATAFETTATETHNVTPCGMGH